MTQWAHSLIRISNYEVETLQKRLAEITARRVSAEMRLTVLEAEAELERERARADHEAGMMLIAYLKGWNLRREEAAQHRLNLEGVAPRISESNVPLPLA